MKKFNKINVEIGLDRKPHYQIEYIENGEIYVGYCSCDFEKVLKWKEENLDVKEIVVNENGKTIYEQGVTDAWEAAKKILMCESDGGLSIEKIKKIFGTSFWGNIFKIFDAAEVIAKIKTYEDGQKEIKVGDEVIMNFAPSVIGIVTHIHSDGGANIMWVDGTTGEYNTTNCEKTGRHFSQIEELLKAMKEK